jgi:hypothetical protein
MGTAAGISLPSASAPVNEKTRASASFDGYDYSSGILQPQQSTNLRLRWLHATKPQQPALRAPPEGRERTPQRVVRLLPPPPLRRVHPPPRIGPSTSYRVHMPMSVKHDYHIKYYSGRLNTYKLDRTTVTVGAPRMLAMSTSPASAGASSCASPSAVTAAGAALSCASTATTSSATAAGSVLP